VRRLDATKCWARASVPPFALLRAARVRVAASSGFASPPPAYLRLARGRPADHHLGGGSSSLSGGGGPTAPTRFFVAVAGPLHATSAHAELGDSKVHLARAVAKPHAFAAALLPETFNHGSSNEAAAGGAAAAPATAAAGGVEGAAPVSSSARRRPFLADVAKDEAQRRGPSEQRRSHRWPSAGQGLHFDDDRAAEAAAAAVGAGRGPALLRALLEQVYTH
jgi:hypothetical protein